MGAVSGRLGCHGSQRRSVWSQPVAARNVILIPPSEGKVEGGSGVPYQPGSLAVDDLDEARSQVLRALGPDHPVHAAPTTAAIERYRGVLYRELDAPSLRGTPRRRLRRDVLIASGLWGLVAPADPIPDYRLKMGARLDPLGKLSTWWRPQLTAALEERIRGAIVWDLLPNEHAAAIEWSHLAPRRRITIRFLDDSGRTVSHWNKLLKGSIVRWLVETGEREPRALADFEHPQGYRLDPDRSDLDPTSGGRDIALVLSQMP